MANMNGANRALLERSANDSPSLELLKEVRAAKDSLVMEQNFDAAAEFRDAEAKLQERIRSDPELGRKIHSIDIDRLTIDVDPPIDIFEVTVTFGNGGIWMESWGSEDLLRAFLQGMRVSFSVGVLPEYEVPRRGRGVRVIRNNHE